MKREPQISNSGKPCARCGELKRYVTNRACVNCTKLHTIARQRGTTIEILVRQQKELRLFAEQNRTDNDDLNTLLGDIE